MTLKNLIKHAEIINQWRVAYHPLMAQETNLFFLKLVKISTTMKNKILVALRLKPIEAHLKIMKKIKKYFNRKKLMRISKKLSINKRV